MKKHCPFCEGELKIIAVDIDGTDILGCDDCGWTESKNDIFEDMYFYIN
jgi:Zn-finger protein